MGNGSNVNTSQLNGIIKVEGVEKAIEELEKIPKALKRVLEEISSYDSKLKSIQTEFFGNLETLLTGGATFKTSGKKFGTSLGQILTSSIQTAMADVKQTLQAEMKNLAVTGMAANPQLIQQILNAGMNVGKRMGGGKGGNSQPKNAYIKELEEYEKGMRTLNRFSKLETLITGKESAKRFQDIDYAKGLSSLEKYSNMAEKKLGEIGVKKQKFEEQQTNFWIKENEKRQKLEDVAFQKNLKKIGKNSAKEWKEYQKGKYNFEKYASMAEAKLGPIGGNVIPPTYFENTQKEFGNFRNTLSTALEEVGGAFREFGGNVRDVLGTVVSMASTAIGHMVDLLKNLAFFAGAAGAAFVGAGAMIASYARSVLNATETMRGYNIALLATMRTQDNVNNLMNTALKVAEDMPMAYDQTIQSIKAYSLITPLRPMLRDTKNLEKNLQDINSIVLGLSQIEPEWGIQGAIFSLREALSGDLLSLKRRFEIPVDLIMTPEGKRLTEIKNQSDKVIKALAPYMQDMFGKEALQATSKQFSVVIAKMEGYYKQFLQKIGESGFYDMVVGDFIKVRDEFKKFIESDVAKGIAERFSNVFSDLWITLKNMFKGIATGIKQLFGVDLSFGNMQDALNGLASATEEYTRIFKIFTNVLNDTRTWDLLKRLFTAVKELAIWAYRTVASTLRSIAADFKYVYGILSGVMDDIQSKLGEFSVDISKETLGKGIFYIWFFGPGNVLALLSGVWKSLGSGINLLKTMVVQVGKVMLGFTRLAVVIGIDCLFALKDFGKYLISLNSRNLLNDLKNTILSIKNGVSSIVKFSLAGWLKGLIGPSSTLATIWGGIFATFTGFYAQILALIGGLDLIQAILRSIFETIGKIDFRALFGDKIVNSIAFVSKTIKFLLSSTWEFIKAMAKGVDILITAALSALAWFSKKLDFTKQWEGIKTTISGIGDDITKVFSELSGDIMSSGFVKFISTAIERFQSAISESTKNVLNKTFIVKPLLKTGYNFLTGTKKAVEEVVPTVKNASESIASNLSDAFLHPIDSFNKLKNTVVSGVKEMVGATGDIKLKLAPGKTMENVPQGTAIAAKNIQDIMTQLLGKTPAITSLYRPSKKESKSLHSLSTGTRAFDIGANQIGKMIDSVEFIAELGRNAEKAGISRILLEDPGMYKMWSKDLIDFIQQDAELRKIIQYLPFSKPQGKHLHFEVAKKAIDRINASGVEKLLPGEGLLKESGDIVGKAIEDAKTKYTKPKEYLKENIELIQSIFSDQAKELEVYNKTYESTISVFNNRATTELQGIMEKFGNNVKFGDQIVIAMENAQSNFFDALDNLSTKTSNVIKKIGSNLLEVFGADVLNNLGLEKGFVSILDSILNNFNESAKKLYAEGIKENIPKALKKSTQQLIQEIPTETLTRFGMSEMDVKFGGKAENKLGREFAYKFPSLAPLKFEATDVNKIKKIFEDIQNEMISTGKAYEDVSNLIEEKNWADLLKQQEIALRNAFETGGIIKFSIESGKQAAILAKHIEIWKKINEEENKFIKTKTVFDDFTEKMNKFGIAINELNFTKPIEDFKKLLDQVDQMDRATAKKVFSKYQESLEMSPRPLTESFQVGIQRGLKEMKNFSEVMEEEGGSLVTNLSSTFETGFFDFMSGKLKTMEDMFKSLGNSVRDMILKIIAKLLALSATKIILGIDLNMNGATGGGGGLLGSITGLLQGNQGQQGSGGLLSNLLGGLLGNKGNKGTQAGTAVAGVFNGGQGFLGNVGTMAQNIFSGKELTTGLAAGKAATAGGGILQTLKASLPLLAAGAAISYLTSPGRLFGGTVDHTGAAKGAQQTAEQERQALQKRRSDDAEKYIYSGMMKGFSDFTLTAPRYYETKSGNGITSKKTKTGNLDLAGYIQSRDEYYQLLDEAAKSHYKKQYEVDKMREQNELQALQYEQTIKTDYLQEIKRMYTESLTKREFEEADKLRDKVYETEYELMKMLDQIAKLAEDTAFRAREFEAYKTFVKGGRELDYQKELLSISRDKATKLKQGTIEWYDAQTEILNQEKELSDNVKNLYQEINADFSDMLVDVIGMGGTAIDTNKLRQLSSDLLDVTLGRNMQEMGRKYGEVIGYTDIARTGSAQFGNKVMQQFTTAMEPVYALNVQNTVERIKKEQTRLKTSLELKSAMDNMQKAMSSFSTDSMTTIFNEISDLNKKAQLVAQEMQKTMDEDLLTSLMKNFYDINTNLANSLNTVFQDVKEFIATGFVDFDIVDFVKLPIEEMKTQFANISRMAKLGEFGNSIINNIKSITDKGFIGKILSAFSSTQTDSLVIGKIDEIKNNIVNTTDMFNAYYMYEKDILQKRLSKSTLYGDEYFAIQDQIFSLEMERLNKEQERIQTLKDMSDTGLIEKITDFMNVTEEMLTNVTSAFKLKDFENSIIGKIKSFEDKNVFSGILNELNTIPETMGVRNQYQDIQNKLASSADPWQTWYDWTYDTVTRKLRNTEEGSDKWFEAQNDLFDLLSERTEHAKQQAEKAMNAMEDMLAKLEETVSMRFAEERKSTRGDVYYIDVAKMGIDTYTINDLRNKIRANDPDASRLLDEIKMKALGVSK